MNTLFRLVIFLLLATWPVHGYVAQTRLAGVIHDRLTKKPIPFATLSLRMKLTGTVCNEHGQFEMHLPGGSETDTLIVNAFGYQRSVLPVKGLSSPVSLTLKQSAVEIEEVKVKPLPPEFYVLEAMRRLKQNYPTKPFQSVAFYRERITENSHFLQSDEAIFKTYCPDYLDTARSQDQLYLYRKGSDIQEMAFLSRERAKQEKKKEERAKREKRKPKSNGKDKESDKDDEGLSFDLGADGISGPQNILRSCRIGTKFWGFLDTTQLDEYTYRFAGSSSYDDRELMVISFATRGKVNYLRETGKIYLDPKSFAVVRIENSGDFIVPAVIRPIIFAYGYGVTNPRYSRNLEFREVGGRWYPQKIQCHVSTRLTKRYMFAPNDKSSFEIDQIFAVTSIGVENPLPVPLSKRFIPKKKMEEQVFNDAGLKWEDVNVVK